MNWLDHRKTELLADDVGRFSVTFCCLRIAVTVRSSTDQPNGESEYTGAQPSALVRFIDILPLKQVGSKFLT